MDLITTLDDDRLTVIEVRCNMDTETKAREDRAALFDSLRAALRREVAEREDRDAMKAERDAALSRAKSAEAANKAEFDGHKLTVSVLKVAEAIASRIEVEGMAKAIEEEQARFPFPAVFSENIARALVAHLLGKEKP